MLAFGGAPSASTPIATAISDESTATTSDLVVIEGQETITLGNQSGVLVLLVPVRSKDEPLWEGHYLFRATGTSSKIDGLVVLVQRRLLRKRQHFFVFLRGEFLSILRYDKGYDRWTLLGYEPARGRDDELTYVDGPWISRSSWK